MDQPGNPPSPAAPAARSRGGRGWRWPLGLGVAAAAWTGLVGAWLPGFIKPRVEQAATEALGTPVALDAVALQPWTLTLTVDGARVGPAHAPYLRVQQAQVQISAESLWRLAPVVRRVTVRGPQVFIERQTPERFNFSPVLDHLSAQPDAADTGEPTRFAVHNIRLEGGAVRYVDRVLNQSHQIDQITLGVPFLSNLPSFVTVDVEPVLSARVNGSPLRVEGRSQPFSASRTSTVSLAWQGVKLPQWLEAARPLLPAGWQVQMPSGELATVVTVRFEAKPSPAAPSVSIEGHATVRALAVQASGLPGVGPLEAGWRELAVTGVVLRPLERQARVGQIALSGLTAAVHPQAEATRVEPGASRARVAATPVAPTPAPEAGWRWQVDAVKVDASQLAVQTQAAAAWPTVQAVKLEVRGLNAAPSSPPATWQLALNDAAGARIEAQGDLQMAAHHASARIDVAGLSLPHWTAPLADVPAWRALPLQPQKGVVSFKTALKAQWDGEGALDLQADALKVADLQARPARTARGVDDRIDWQQLALAGVAARVEGGALQTVSIDNVALTGLDARVRRDGQGRVLGLGGPPASSKARTPPATPATAAPRWTVGRVQCEGCQLRFVDESVEPAARFDASRLALTVQGLSHDLRGPLAVDLDTRAQGKGELRFKGTVRPQPLSVQAQVAVRNLEFGAVRPYLDPLLNVSLARAQAQAAGRLQLQDDPRKGLSARYQGRAGITGLRVLDRLNEADFLTWQTLALDNLDVRWAANAPLDADLGRIRLQGFYGRVIVNPDGRLNLAHIVRQPDEETTRSITTPAPSSAASAPMPAAASTPVAPAHRLRWQQIQLADGRVDFTDNFIQPNYSARLTQVEGTISAVSSERTEPAEVRIAGAVDDAAPLRITGKLHPLGPRLYTDIQGSAKGIELTRLTPYAARYAGYAIDKGTLSVNVHYQVDGGQLKAENQVFLDQLTFGDKVDSPDATSLPVRLAVSLLKNRQGEIDINLPISGSLDEPEFSVGGIIWRVFVNLITKAVTAPFSLLSGGGSEELGFVPFAPGSTELDATARQRLTTLATKLADRPALKLQATGQADPAADAEGLRAAHVERLMREAKARATRQPLADVTVAESERLTWLTAAYKAADIQKPRNLVGLAKALQADEMTALLKASAPVDARALRELADRRGDAVKAFLATQLPPERVMLTASRVDGELPRGETGPATRVQFAIR